MERENTYYAWLAQFNRYLSKYYGHVAFRTNKNYFDISRNAETIYRGVLNATFGLTLIHAGFKDEYRPIDLVDTTNRVAVVVSPAAPSLWYVNKATEFKDNHLNDSISHLIFVCQGEASTPDILRKMKIQNVELHFLDQKALAAHMTQTEGDQRQQLQSHLNDCYDLVTSQNPYKLHYVRGHSDHYIRGSREEEVIELVSMIDFQSPIIISGVRGIGKSEVARTLAAVASPACGHGCTKFVPPADCSDDPLRETILKLDIFGYDFPDEVEYDQDKDYALRMNILKRHFKGSMIFLENVNWGDRKLHEILCGPTYDRLLKMRIQLVIVTRCSRGTYRGITVGPLKRDMQEKLMRRLTHWDADKPATELFEVSAAVGENTHAITLVCNTIFWMWSFDEVSSDVKQLLETGSCRNTEDAWFPEISTDKDQSYISGRLPELLMQEFDLQDLTNLRTKLASP